LAPAAPEQLVEYVPTALDEVAVVEQVGLVVSDEADWPFTKPEYEAVIDGGVPPNVIVPDDAVTVSGAGVIETDPLT
jgi:hypothetical protein